jgi:hypothetical protein
MTIGNGSEEAVIMEMIVKDFLVQFWGDGFPCQRAISSRGSRHQHVLRLQIDTIWAEPVVPLVADCHAELCA